MLIGCFIEIKILLFDGKSTIFATKNKSFYVLNFNSFSSYKNYALFFLLDF